MLLFCTFGFFCLSNGGLLLLGISTLRQSVEEKGDIVINSIYKYYMIHTELFTMLIEWDVPIWLSL